MKRITDKKLAASVNKKYIKEVQVLGKLWAVYEIDGEQFKNYIGRWEH